MTYYSRVCESQYVRLEFAFDEVKKMTDQVERAIQERDCIQKNLTAEIQVLRANFENLAKQKYSERVNANAVASPSPSTPTNRQRRSADERDSQEAAVPTPELVSVEVKDGLALELLKPKSDIYVSARANREES